VTVQVKALRLRSLQARLLLFVLPPVVLAIGGLTVFVTARASDQAKDARYAEMAQAAAAQAGRFDATQRGYVATAKGLAAAVEAVTGGDRDGVIRIARRVIDRNPELDGAFVGFQPNAFDGRDAEHVNAPGSDGQGHFVPYWNKLSGPLRLDPAKDVYSADYWAETIQTGKTQVVEPFEYEGSLMTTFTAPIKRDGQIVGLASVDLSLLAANNQTSVKLLKTGYGFLVSRGGVFVTAPDSKLIGKKTLAQVAQERRNSVLAQAAKMASQGRSGQVETTDPWTGKRIVLSWTPLETSQWVFFTAVPVAEVLAPVNDLRNALLVIGLVALGLVTAIVLVLARRLTRPIRALTRTAERVATGDAEVDVEVRGADEVGRMAAAFRETVGYLREKAEAADRIADGDLTVEVEPRSERDLLGHAFRRLGNDLREIVGRVSATASTVSAASQQMATSSDEAGRAIGEIASAVGDVAQGAERQVRMVEATREAIQETARMAGTSAEDARETATAANEAREVATAGVEAAHEATDAMRRVAGSTDEVRRAMAELSSKSERIGGIVDTITAIAEQTNLLALNAAIEAARAGEQGRGFAVVAEEVRKLAEESHAATGEIASLISEIQHDTGRVVDIVADSARRTDEGVATVDRTREAFERISAAVERVTSRVNEISAAIERISGESQRARDAIDEVATVAEASSASAEQVSASTEETSASTQEIAASAASLARTAQELEELVHTFRLSA
jgi:methyl-accepting chemotaxis protein